ncbi:MAG: tetratricopeptide repeat protein [Bacteroidota bacterium]
MKTNLKMQLKPAYFLVFLLACFSASFAQTKEKSKEQIKIERESNKYLAQGNEAIINNDFTNGEVDLRKAIALSPREEVGKYNLGTAYYNKEKNDEAMNRFKQAAEVATSKPEKHKAFHNLGNTFMNAKDYQSAVEAYKNALRSNPTDDETRYNLALAKDLLEKNPPQGGDGDNDNENKDQDNQDQNQDNQDQENQDQDNQDKNKDSDDKEGENEEDKDQGDQEKEENQGDDEGENKKPDDPKETPQQQPQPGQMSPQQIKNLLEAMNNEEKKVQDKINAKKQKGVKVKSNKDW